MIVAALAIAHAGWALLYVERTSFLIGTARVYSLWDDGMISMTYARNLAEGNGLVWNAGGERVQGFSNPGVTVLMAAVHLLPVGPLKTSAVFQVLQIVALGFILLALSRLPRLFWDADPWVGPATVAVAALFAPLSIWALQGSDVGLLTAALAGATWLAGRSYARSGRMGVAPFLPLAVGVVLRIDATLFYAVFMAVAARDQGGRRSLVRALLILVATWSLLLGASWAYYGDPLPNTYYLKATGAPRALVLGRGLSELWQTLQMLSLPIVAVVATWVRSPGTSRAPLALLWGPAAVGVAYNVWVGGDWRPDYLSRFVVAGLVTAIPLMIGATLWVATVLTERAAPGRPWRTALLMALVAGLTFQLNPRAAIEEWLVPGRETMLRKWNLDNTRHGLYFAGFTAPGTTLALHWAGAPAYFARRPAIDVLGRSDRHIAKMKVDLHEPGHSKWDWDYVLGARRPDIFLHESRGLVERADFQRDYVHVRTPEGLQFFLRTESASRLRDSEAVLTPIATH